MYWRTRTNSSTTACKLEEAAAAFPEAALGINLQPDFKPGMIVREKAGCGSCARAATGLSLYWDCAMMNR